MMTVLVIEGNDTSYLLTKFFLESTRATIIRAHNIVDAEVILNTLSIDLVLTDAVHPENLDSIEITKKVKAIFPEVPVIIKSTNPYPNIVAQSFYAGCDDYILKPFSPKDLLSKIEKYAGAEVV